MQVAATCVSSTAPISSDMDDLARADLQRRVASAEAELAKARARAAAAEQTAAEARAQLQQSRETSERQSARLEVQLSSLKRALSATSEELTQRVGKAEMDVEKLVLDPLLEKLESLESAERLAAELEEEMARVASAREQVKEEARVFERTRSKWLAALAKLSELARQMSEMAIPARTILSNPAARVHQLEKRIGACAAEAAAFVADSGAEACSASCDGGEGSARKSGGGSGGDAGRSDAAGSGGGSGKETKGGNGLKGGAAAQGSGHLGHGGGKEGAGIGGEGVPGVCAASTLGPGGKAGSGGAKGRAASRGKTLSPALRGEGDSAADGDGGSGGGGSGGGGGGGGDDVNIGNIGSGGGDVSAKEMTVTIVKPKREWRLGLHLHGLVDAQVHSLDKGAAVSGLLIRGDIIQSVNNERVQGHVHATALLREAVGEINLRIIRPSRLDAKTKN